MFRKLLMVYHFNVSGDILNFISEGSDSFTYIDVSDGERFMLRN